MFFEKLAFVVTAQIHVIKLLRTRVRFLLQTDGIAVGAFNRCPTVDVKALLDTPPLPPEFGVCIRHGFGGDEAHVMHLDIGALHFTADIDCKKLHAVASAFARPAFASALMRPANSVATT